MLFERALSFFESYVQIWNRLFWRSRGGNSSTCSGRINSDNVPFSPLISSLRRSRRLFFWYPRNIFIYNHSKHDKSVTLEVLYTVKSQAGQSIRTLAHTLQEVKLITYSSQIQTNFTSVVS